MVAVVNPDPMLLDSLTRAELIERARAVGAVRPELLTRIELRDEILRLTQAKNPTAVRFVGGWEWPGTSWLALWSSASICPMRRPFFAGTCR